MYVNSYKLTIKELPKIINSFNKIAVYRPIEKINYTVFLYVNNT